ncbi:MAG: GNAT family N-acetyltransferase [Candidatus Cryosericum sp.]
MTTVRNMTREDIPAYVQLIAGCYPTMQLTTTEKREQAVRRMLARMDEPVECSHVGVFNGPEMVGGMIIYPFTMNWRGAMVAAGGVGMVGTSLMHRHEHVARDMIRWFVTEQRDRGAMFALLYPFSTAFYHRMGFGFSSPDMRYELAPGLLPTTGDRSLCRVLSAADADLVRQHCHRVVMLRNGMVDKREFELQAMVDGSRNLVGVQEADRITGFVRFGFTDSIEGNFLNYDMVVDELSYETGTALRAILAYLNSLADQVRRVRISTQDPEFYHFADDPCDTSGVLVGEYYRMNQGGVGLMVRLTGQDIRDEDLASARFGSGTTTVALDVAETLTGETAAHIGLCFEDGRAGRTAPEGCCAHVGLGVADASSLLTGAVSLRTLADLGRADVTPYSMLGLLDGIFRTETPPVCTTEF